jgi:hypothetical protein
LYKLHHHTIGANYPQQSAGSHGGPSETVFGKCLFVVAVVHLIS